MRAAWVLLPILGSPIVHAPIMKTDALQALKRPIDGGRTLRGRRLLGDNKTWRGALAMTAGPLLATTLLSRSAWWRSKVPAEVAAANPVVVGALLGASVWVGELPNSFLKRQLGIAPGAQDRSTAGVLISVVDQFDFVLGVALLVRPVWRPTVRDVAEMAAVVTVVHLPLNVAGKLLGVRSSWL
jgi:hypothetical protein